MADPRSTAGMCPRGGCGSGGGECQAKSPAVHRGISLDSARGRPHNTLDPLFPVDESSGRLRKGSHDPIGPTSGTSAGRSTPRDSPAVRDGVVTSPVRRRTALFGELPGRRPRHRTRAASGTNSNRLTGPTVSPSRRGTDPRLSAGRDRPSRPPGPHLRHHPLHRHPRYRRTRAGGADDQDFLVAGGVKVETSRLGSGCPATRSSGSWAAAAWASSTRPGSSSSNRARRPQDDPRRRATPAPRTWPASSRGRGRRPAAAPQHRADLRGRRARRPAVLLAGVRGRRQPRPASSRASPLPPREAAALVETLARAMHAAHQRGHRPPRPEAGQRAADRRRHRRRSPTSAWPSGSTRASRARPAPAPSWARPATWPPSRPAATPATSAPPPTSTPWGPSCTSC